MAGQRIDVIDLGQDSAEGVLLLLGMRAARRSPARTRRSSLIRSRMFMWAAEAQYGFHAGQQDAEPEWQKVLTRPTNQQDAENAGRWAQGPMCLFYRDK